VNAPSATTASFAIFGPGCVNLAKKISWRDIEPASLKTFRRLSYRQWR